MGRKSSPFPRNVFFFEMKVFRHVSRGRLRQYASILVCDDHVCPGFGFHKSDVVYRPFVKMLFEDVSVAVAP